MSRSAEYYVRRQSSSTADVPSQSVQRNFAERIATLSDPARRLHRAILRAFLENGSAPTVADLRPIARASGVGIERLLTEMAVHDVIQRAPHGAIQVAYPFSSSATAHQVQLEGGPTVYAMCVIDALGLPFMAGRPGTILTEDPVDATPITIIIGCGSTGKPTSSQVRWLPTTAVVLVNRPPEGPVIQAECSCPYLNAFASRDSLRQWRAAHTDLDLQVLSQKQAVQEARRIFGRVLVVTRGSNTGRTGEIARHPRRQFSTAARRRTLTDGRSLTSAPVVASVLVREPSRLPEE
jgi:hypothetical protein